MRWLYLHSALALSIGLLFLTDPASAALQEEDLFAPGDGLLTLDTGTGLEWLDLELTNGLSVSDALAAYNGLGFSIANTDQTTQLFLNAGFSVLDQFFGNPADFDNALLMLSLTGCTNLCGTDFAEGRGWARPGNDAPPVPGAEFFAPLYRIDLFFLDPPGIDIGLGLGLSPDGFTLDPDPITPVIGTFLVREIPEPGTALLVGMGLVAVGVQGRRRTR